MNQNTTMSRRGFFTKAGQAGLAAAGLAALPNVASANTKVTETLAKYVPGSEGAMAEKVTLETPIIAENGAVVPVTVKVDHPQEADNYIKSLTILVESNPTPFAANFNFTPKSGNAGAALRLKIGKTSKVSAYAVTNTGKVYMASNDVKVTIGGCGG